MQKIDYSTRALFEEFISEDTSFIKEIIKRNNIHSVLEIPCANGRNLSTIGSAVSNAIFADINPNMIEIVQQKIVSGNWNNCLAKVLDLCDLSNLEIQVDAILIMQQSFQMISAEQGQKALQNMKKANCKSIIIDVYDFRSKASDTPKYLVSNNSFLDSENRNWIRYSTVLGIRDSWVHIIHKYKSTEETYFAEVKLYNYSRSQLISLCQEAGYHILDYYTDYSFGKNDSLGRTIVVIQRNDIGVL